MSQLSLILRREDGRWRANLDIGTPGLEHARAVNRQEFVVEDALAAALLSTVNLAIAEADPPLAGRLIEFFQAGLS